MLKKLTRREPSQSTQTNKPSKNIASNEVYELIRKKAFEFYMKRKGSGPGDSMSDWLKAEKQVREELKLR